MGYYKHIKFILPDCPAQIAHSLYALYTNILDCIQIHRRTTIKCDSDANHAAGFCVPSDVKMCKVLLWTQPEFMLSKVISRTHQRNFRSNFLS